MPYVYVGTAAQVDAVRTAALLFAHPVHAIWCPPPTLRLWNVTVDPVGGEMLLMTWRVGNEGPVLPLGFGVLRPTPQPPKYNTQVLWTNADIPGVNAFAQVPGGLGYDGGDGASYLRLGHVAAVRQGDADAVSAALPPLQNGMNQIQDPPPWNAGAALPCGC